MENRINQDEELAKAIDASLTIGNTYNLGKYCQCRQMQGFSGGSWVFEFLQPDGNVKVLSPQTVQRIGLQEADEKAFDELYEKYKEYLKGWE